QQASIRTELPETMSTDGRGVATGLPAHGTSDGFFGDSDAESAGEDENPFLARRDSSSDRNSNSDEVEHFPLINQMPGATIITATAPAPAASTTQQSQRRSAFPPGDQAATFTTAVTGSGSASFGITAASLINNSRCAARILNDTANSELQTEGEESSSEDEAEDGGRAAVGRG
ncbi:unnamed protein product, partial [Pylaiella littoralis]